VYTAHAFRRSLNAEEKYATARLPPTV
jgi:hypothetical protein